MCECPIDVGAVIHRIQAEAQRKTDQHCNRIGSHNCGQARIRNRFRQPDVNVQAERRGDLVLEELPQTAVPFNVTAGAPVEAVFSARVAPSSVGSGYFMVIFLNATGEFQRTRIDFVPGSWP